MIALPQTIRQVATRSTSRSIAAFIESLTNVIRDARARHATVDLVETCGAATLVLTVRDVDCGTRSEQSAGFGIRGMQERVEGLGGKFIFEKAENGGVRLGVSIPTIEGCGARADAVDAIAGAQT